MVHRPGPSTATSKRAQRTQELGAQVGYIRQLIDQRNVPRRLRLGGLLAAVDKGAEAQHQTGAQQASQRRAQEPY